jgi:hypothetical protein
MRKTILTILLLAAGCAGQNPSMTELQKDCRYDTTPFVEAWPCMKSAMVDRSYRRMPDDLRQQYVLTGDVVVERLKGQKISETEGRLEMANVLASINTSIAQRERTAPYAGIVCTRGVGTTLICY